MGRARWGPTVVVTTALLAAVVGSPARAAEASTDGPPKIGGVRFGVSTVSVSGLHVAEVPVAVRLTDQDGVISIGDALCYCPTPRLSVVSLTGRGMRQGVPLELVEGTAQDGWWQGQLEVGSLDDGELRVYNVEAFDSTYDQLNTDPAQSGFDPRLKVIGSDPPALSAGWSPKVITFGETSAFKGRVVHRDDGSPWPGVTIRIYEVDEALPLVGKTITDEQGYWGGIFRSEPWLVAAVTGPDAFFIASNYKTLAIRWKLWGKLSSSRIQLGHSTTVWGSVAPGAAATNQKAFLQRFVSGAWKTVGTAEIHLSGRYYLTARPPSRGYHRYRVFVPGDAGSYVSNVTPVMILAVS